MQKKIDFLKYHKIPAIFFCRGEFIPGREEHLVHAIKNGFLVGNHSYTHPYFSSISLGSCFQEILKTEALIDSCYHSANVLREKKVIRLPFGDRAEGKKLGFLQAFLKEQGFEALDFGVSLQDNFIDAGWTWNTFDYKKKMIPDRELYRLGLEKHWANSIRETEVMLLHDFDNNHHLFEETMLFFLEKKSISKIVFEFR